MNSESWTKTRRDFERLREMVEVERELWLRAHEARGEGSTSDLRRLLAADQVEDQLLDSDAPALHAAWSRRTDARSALGMQVGGYRLAEIIGEGGSATVYRADRADRAGGKGGAGSVAVKILKSEACSPGLSKRFEQEREALSGLDHPGLIRVQGAGHLDDGRPYLVTEFIAGLPIDQFCEHNALDLAARIALFIEVCRGVHGAHRHLVVHRDLKPSNILVSAETGPKVLDFGVAKLLDPERDPLWTDLYGRGPLTVAYASPEQVRGETITTASDIYSLGVLLHELVTGASPYAESASEREALERAVAAARRRAPELAARASGKPAPPADVALILERALAPRPGDRYASAEHLAQDLECFLEGRALLSRSEPWQRRASRLARRHPWAVSVCAALVLVLAGSWIGTERSLRRVVAGERVAWRAHANAVQSTNLLADLLGRIGSSALADGELARMVLQTEAQLEGLADQPETEARLRMALARLMRELGELDAADAHLVRALELSRDTRGLSWNDTERCLEQLCDLRALRGDARCVELGRERVALLGLHDDAGGTARAQRRLEALQAQFAVR